MTKINCDMGESFGIYNAGNDEQIMPEENSRASKKK